MAGLPACSAQSLSPTGPRPVLDASTRDLGAGKGSFDASTWPLDATAFDAPSGSIAPDAAGCDCQLGSDGVLRMPWACFTHSFGIGSPATGWCGAPGQWTESCGLDIFTYDNEGRPYVYVYDKNGLQVGARYQNPSDSPFECPVGLLMSATVASGTFPASTCPTVVCSCDLFHGGGTFICPAADAGSPDAARADAHPLDAGWPTDGG